MDTRSAIAEALTTSNVLAASGLNVPPELGFHQGRVIEWNAATGTNRIAISGNEFVDIPGIISSDNLVLHSGDLVAILRYHSTYFIIGRISVQPAFSGFVIPVPMFAAFESTRISGTVGNAATQMRLNASVLFGTDRQIWEGRLCASSGQVRVDGIWGNLSGTQAVTYKLKVNGVTIGQWTTANGLTVGPSPPSLATFSVSNVVGQPFTRIEITAQSTVNNGDQIACHLLGIYQ